MIARRLLSAALISLLATAASAQVGPTTGFDAPPPPPPPERPTKPLEEGETLKATHGDWQVRCIEGQDGCYIFQLALNPEGNPAAELSVVPLEQEGVSAGFTVLLPLGVLLQEGLIVQVDQNPGVRHAYRVCTNNGCVARFGVRTETVENMKSGQQLLMGVSALNLEAPVALQISLRGFTRAFAELTETAE
ncbi:MAG: invasion associated locus B family protein [Pseudomonadota bacterium]